MKKSNWIILAVLLVASIFFLWLWYYLNFNLVDDPFDLVLTIIWWVLVAVACFAIHRAEKKRQERVRTTFLAPSQLFNCEAGLLPMEDGATAVESLEQTLAGLEYNFHMEDFPNKDKVKFEYIVHSSKFEFEKSEEDQQETAADAQGEPQVQAAQQEKADIHVTEWEGEVVIVAKPDDDPQTFSSREELLAILQGAPKAAAA